MPAMTAFGITHSRRPSPPACPLVHHNMAWMNAKKGITEICAAPALALSGPFPTLPAGSYSAAAPCPATCCSTTPSSS